MKAFAATIVASMASSALAFAPASSKSTASSLKDMPERLWDSMVDKNERSASVPFLPRAKALDGTMAGDMGFDPFYLSSIPKNFAGFIQPPSWEPMGEGLPTLYWMRESELKHCRVAMLAVFGWLATDGVFGLPLRFPQELYQSIPSSYSAHDVLVEQGSMTVMLLFIGVIEICTGAVLVQVAKGEVDRAAGDFGFDPLNMLNGPKAKKLANQEIANGRLAMLAFGGLATQTALGHPLPPYF